MRCFVAVFVLAMLAAILVAACNSSGAYCEKWCNRLEECCDSDPGCDSWDDFEKEHCRDNCAVTVGTMEDSFLDGLEECNDLPCGDEQARMACMDALYAECTDDVTEYLEPLCNKRFECFQDQSVEDCIEMQSSLVRCYTPKALEAGVTCSSEADCESYNDDFKTCLERELGITF